jgi:hypothetical protein
MLQNGETTCTTCTVPGIICIIWRCSAAVCVSTQLCTTGTTLQGYYTHNKIKNC